MASTVKTTFKEIFRSPFLKDTESDALRVLEQIRKAHPSSAGWVEIRGYVEPHNGKYRAVREHMQVKN